MDAVLLRSLPVRDPQQLVYLRTSGFPGGQTGYGDTSMRMQVYEALRQEKRVFSDLMAWVPLGIGKIPVRYGTQPEEAQADMASGNFFSGLGVPSAAGRTFTLDDEIQHASAMPIEVAEFTWSRISFSEHTSDCSIYFRCLHLYRPGDLSCRQSVLNSRPKSLR